MQLKNIKIIAMFLCVTNLLFSPVFADEKPEWFTCDSDADCVIAGSCMLHGINKKFQTEASGYYSEQESAMDCPQRKFEDYQVTCQHYKTSCKKKTLVGEVDDPESTCAARDMKCVVSSKQSTGK